jgi:alpha-galactosidase
MAVGLFNLSGEPAPMEFSYRDIGIPRPAKLRDLWAHQDITPEGDAYRALVPAHGVVLLRVER